MRFGLFHFYRRCCEEAALPVYAKTLLQASCGRERGITLRHKVSLIRAIRRNTRSITSATGWMEHLLLVTQVLSLPQDLPGDIVECGCFHGSSTSSLSLACAMTNRRLIVCDSFEGLPEVKADDAVHVSEAMGRFETYRKGQYAASLESVKDTVSRFGNLGVCEFVRGFFDVSLRAFSRPAAMIFLDVDLHESLRTCLKHLWPCLSDYGFLYTHEATQLKFVSLFFDREFWNSELGCEPPGLVGAGCGLPTGIGHGSGLGYAQKLPSVPARLEDPRLKRFCGDPTAHLDA